MRRRRWVTAKVLEMVLTDLYKLNPELLNPEERAAYWVSYVSTVSQCNDLVFALSSNNQFTLSV